MLIRRVRAFASIGALLALVLATSTAVTASSTKRADATCTGANSPQIIETRDANGNVVARESAAYPFATCDSDSQYAGALQDSLTDGSCAYVYYLEPLALLALEGTSCTTGAWSGYSYHDTIGTNSVLVSPRPSYLLDLWRSSYGY